MLYKPVSCSEMQIGEMCVFVALCNILSSWFQMSIIISKEQLGSLIIKYYIMLKMDVFAYKWKLPYAICKCDIWEELSNGFASVVIKWMMTFGLCHDTSSALETVILNCSTPILHWCVMVFTGTTLEKSAKNLLSLEYYLLKLSCNYESEQSVFQIPWNEKSFQTQKKGFMMFLLLVLSHAYIYIYIFLLKFSLAHCAKLCLGKIYVKKILA
jgi:hypothetical protein